ncbi:MAG: sporulation integral membrane protein YtvI [Firmicutes bacterium]|nr:sporulation integral membrane protein YtvI [Bacillota bacterium]MDH7494942.1 sporulation integral membrane protein YtvI [Bacillota bacterium]
MQRLSATWKHFLAWAAVLVGCFLVVKYVLTYFVPFIIAFVIAAVIDPPVEFLVRRTRLSRGGAVLIVLCLLLIVVGLGVVVGVSRIYLEIQALSRALPMLNISFEEMLSRIVRDVERVYRELPAPVIDAIRNNQYRLYLAIESILAKVTGMVTALPGVGLVLFISFFAAFFMSRDKKEISEFVVTLAPPKWRERAKAMRAEMVSAVLGFIRAQLILILITTVVSVIGFAVAGVGYAWVLGIVCGILDLIPVVGPGTLYVPMIVYYALKKQLFEAVVIGALMAVQFVLRKGAEPRVVGANVGVHPLAILVAVYVGMRLFGAGGIVIGPVFVIMIRAIARGGLLPVTPRE